MTSNPRSSASYAYYSFPPTPSRSSPTAQSSTQSTPQKARNPKSMAPSPAAGKTADPPKTPTKTGKNPESSSTSKLSSNKATPRSKPPKLVPSKSTPKKDTDSPSLPPRPKAQDSKQQAESSAGDVTESEAENKIGLKDNSAKDDVEETPGKVSQLGNETEGENELSEAAPEPVDDDEGEEAPANASAAHDAQDDGEEAVAGAKDPVDDTGDDADDDTETAEPEEEEETSGGALGSLKRTAGGVASGAKGAAGKAAGAATGAKDSATNAAGKVSKGDVSGAASGVADDATKTTEDTADDVKDTAEDTTEDVKDTAEDTTEDVKDTAEDTTEGVKDTAEDTTEDVKDTAEETAEGATDEAQATTNGVKDTAEDEAVDVTDKTKDLPDGEEGVDVDGVKDTAEGAADDAEGAVDEAKETAEDAADDLPEVDLDEYLPMLKGLKVEESGEILDADGEPLGQLDAGDAADLEGMEIGENGEILDEDGDVVGRASVLPQRAQEMAKKAKEEAEGAVETELPEIGVLEGLEAGEDGEIKDKDGNVLGKITEGDPKDLAGMPLNAEGEILDEEGDVIGRAEVVPQEVKDKVDEAKEAADEAKEGVAEVQAQVEEAQEGVTDAQKAVDELVEQLAADLTILEGRKLNKKGNIIDDEGEVIGKLVEGDPKKCAGKVPNEKGEILDDKGEVIGKVEIVEGDAANEAMKELHPELAEKLEEAQGQLEEKQEALEEAEKAAEEGATGGLPGLDILEGLKVNKKGEVVNEDGDAIAKLSEGELDQVRGKKINDKGEILDKDGNVIGKVELIPSAFEGVADEIEEAAPEVPDTSILEGLKVNKKGEVLNEDGEPIARLSEGELADVAGKKLNDKGEILDKDGNVIGKVEMIPQEPEEGSGEDLGDEFPPLSILEGLRCNKAGKIVDASGKPIGELVEGDPKKLAKLGITCDDQGQFWDTKGHVIGRAKTLPQEDQEDTEAEFAGLEGLVVVKDGWVEDENGNRVGQLTEGDPKKLVGRAVDEDGDVLDKRGNVVGHAERYVEPEAEVPEEVKVDLSEMKGLTVNKAGNVIGPSGVPIGRLVEGNPKELAGKKVDGEGQIWNDAGEVIGRCELIPPDQREEKPEGIFGGLDGLVVVKDGLVEDSEGNVVGRVIEGDAKKLIGRAVDEDGEIVDKYGNVKGRCEPYEIPQEEEVVKDLSSLDGKTVNKQGNVVDPQGNIFGQVIDGELKRLVGCAVDGQGQIWSKNGKVIGHADTIEGGDEGKAEGPFSNFESTIVAKEGEDFVVKDASGQIVGRIVEGDPKKLVGRKVDDDGDIVDKNGNVIGKAERWEPDVKEREKNPMAGFRVNQQGEVRDDKGEVIGLLTDGNLLECVGKEVNDNGYVVDQDGQRIGACTLLSNIPEPEEAGPSEEELKKAEENEIAKKISGILNDTISKMEPICKGITEVCLQHRLVLAMPFTNTTASIAC